MNSYYVPNLPLWPCPPFKLKEMLILTPAYEFKKKKSLAKGSTGSLIIKQQKLSLNPHLQLSSGHVLTATVYSYKEEVKLALSSNHFKSGRHHLPGLPKEISTTISVLPDIKYLLLHNKSSQFLAALTMTKLSTHFLRVRSLGITQLACSGFELSGYWQGLESSEGLSGAQGFTPNFGSLTRLFTGVPSFLPVGLRSL